MRIFVLWGMLIFLVGTPQNSVGGGITPTITENNVNDEIIPENAYTYDPNQVSLPGSNVGILLNATAVTSKSVTTSDWTPIVGGGNALTNPWKVELPGRAISDSSETWRLQNGNIRVEGLADSDNYIPGYETAQYKDNFQGGTSGDRWIYPGQGYYTEDYWGTGSNAYEKNVNQIYNPENGVELDEANYVVTPSVDFTAAEQQVGFMRLDNAERFHNYTMDQDGIIPTSNLLAGTGRVGVANRTAKWYLSTELKGYNNYFAANAETGSTTLVARYDNTTWGGNGWGDQRGNYSISHAVDRNAQTWTTQFNVETYYRMYYSQTKSGTIGDFYTKCEGKWEAKYRMVAEFRMPFYYKDESVGTSIGKFGADIDFTQTKPFKGGVFDNTGNGVSNTNFEITGSISYKVVNSGGTTIGSTVIKEIKDEALYDGILSNTYFDLAAGGEGDFGTTITSANGEWFYYVIVADVSLFTKGDISKTSTIYYHGTTASGPSTVDIGFVENHGFTMTVKKPWVSIRESSKIKAPGQPYIERYITSTPINWYKHTINMTEPKLSFGYRIPNTIFGADATELSLNYGKIRAKLLLRYIDGRTIEYCSHYDDSGFGFKQVRDRTDNPWGVGCDRFEWLLNSTIKNAMNSTLDNFTISVGFILYDGFELHLNTGNNAKIYFNNINFQLNTIPDPSIIGLKVRFLEGSEKTVIGQYDLVNYGTYSQFTIPMGHEITQRYWDIGSQYDQFDFVVSGSPASFTYTATFVANYSYWDKNTTIYTTPSMIYIEFNQTINTPKPYAYPYYQGTGTPITDSKFITYWHDSFNMFVVIPKYTIGSTAYWDLKWAFDNENPFQYNAPREGTTSFSDWRSYPNLKIYRETNPVNIWGDSSKTNGKIQVLHFDYDIFKGYVASNTSNGGVNYMDWDFHFQMPNELGNIILDNDLNYIPDGPEDKAYYDHVFYASSVTTSDFVNIQVNRTNAISEAIENMTHQFEWGRIGQAPLHTVQITPSSSGGNYHSDQQFYLDPLYPKGPDYIALSWFSVKDVCVSGRPGDQNQKWLNGIYRAGLNYSFFEVRGKTIVRNFTITNTVNMTSPFSDPPSQMLIYNTSGLDLTDKANMMCLNVTWADENGNDLIPGADVRIWMTHFRTREAGVIIPSYETSFRGAQLVENLSNPGQYYIWLDPIPMDNIYSEINGNVSRGYHEFNITFSKPGYESITFQGNFSIIIDTILEITAPEHLTSLIRGEDRYHHYTEDCYAGLPYMIQAKYYVNRTDKTEYISNWEGDYFENNTFMVYNLINVRNYSDFSQILNYNQYVNESFWDINLGSWDNQTRDSTWPIRGYMKSSSASQFFAYIKWPAFGDADYTAGDVPLYLAQANGKDNEVILEYELSVWVRVNRTKSDLLYQPNDVLPQFTEGVGDTNTDLYSAAVKVHEESFLIHLQDSTKGNSTRIILLNNATADGETYNFAFNKTTEQGQKEFYSIYNPDLEDAANWVKDGENYYWLPDYQIGNYRTNLSHNAGLDVENGRFRFRLIFNCSYIPFKGESYYYGGINGSEIIPMGPLNQSTIMYGVNNSWMGPTSIFMTGWNASNIPFHNDSTYLWNTTIKDPSENVNTVFGETYYSDWLYLNQIDAGTYLLYITARKPGFIPYTQIVRLTIFESPTVLLNGSKTNPQVPEDRFSLKVGEELQIKTATGKPVAFYVNYTDVTNVNSSINVTLPILGASLKCTVDDDSGIWKNETMFNSWYFTPVDGQPGNYMVNITDTDVPVGLDTGQIIRLTFEMSRSNYQVQNFKVLMNVTKRASAFGMLANISQDYYYAYSYETVNELLLNPLTEVSRIKYTVQLYDLVFDNVAINVEGAYKTFFTLEKSYNGGIFELLGSTQWMIEAIGNNSFNVTFATNTPPGDYKLRLTFQNYPRYYTAIFEHTVTILPGLAQVTLNEGESRAVTRYYYYIDNETVEVNTLYVPMLRFRFIDMIHVDRAGNPIEFFPDDNFRITTNWTNEHRAYIPNDIKLDPGTGHDYISVKAYAKGQPYSTLYLDTMGIDVKYTPDNTGYLPYYVATTFNRTNFQVLSMNVSFIIQNVTTRLFPQWSQFEDNQRVLVKSYEYRSNWIEEITQTTDTTIYSSTVRNETNIAFKNPIYYNFLVQTYIGYFEFNSTSNFPIKNDPHNPLKIDITIDQPLAGSAGINYFLAGDTEITGGNPLTYTVLYFQATPVEGVTKITINFTIFKNNYAPISYKLIFNVIDHTTTYTADLKDTIDFGGILLWEIRYIDYSRGINLGSENIDGARIYFPGAPQGILHSDNIANSRALYEFEDGVKMLVEVVQDTLQAPGKYYIKFYTDNLTVRDQPYEINLTISKPHYDSKQILTTTGGIPYFKVTPVNIRIDVWMTKTDSKPAVTDEMLPSTYINPSVNKQLFVWVRVYAEIKRGNEIELRPLTQNEIKINCTLFSQTETATGVQSKELLNFDFRWDTVKGIFVAVINMTYESGLEQVELRGLHMMDIKVYPMNQNYGQKAVKNYFLVSLPEAYVPWWIYVLGAFTIGSSLLIAGFGIKKALQLRIPFVLRMIDETIEKITQDKFPSVGVMLGRREFVINKVIDYLDMVGIEWAIQDKFEEEELGEEGEDEEKGEVGGAGGAAPMDVKELTIELNKIESLSPDDRELFLDELKRLNRKEQEDFLQGLRTDS
jgi:hypothetical protein